MITLLLIILPALIALLLAFSNEKYAKQIALGGSVLVLIASLLALSQFQYNAEFQFRMNREWIHSLGINFHIGLDGIGLLLVLLTTFLIPIILLTSFNVPRSKAFYVLVLVMQSGLIGVFSSMDGFLFYVFWEIALIPAYLICLMWGGENKIFITFRFFIYTLAGSLLMLAAFIYIYLQTPYPHSFDVRVMHEVFLSSTAQSYIFWALFIAFAIKMPVFPFHTWQPDSYVNAPSQGTMLLSGIMLKMGIFGLLRWLLPICPEGISGWGNVAIILSVIGIVYASLLAWVQKDFKRLIAYSSIAHVGLISAGVFSLTEQGLQGSILQMLSHGVIAVGLFFVCQILFERGQSHRLESFGGIRNRDPLFAGFFLIILLGSIGLPLTSGFIGEFLLLNGLFQYNTWLAACAGLGMILGAVYMLNAYRILMLGEETASSLSFTLLNSTEKLTLFIIVGLILFLGLFPNSVLQIAEPSILKIMEQTIN